VTDLNPPAPEPVPVAPASTDPAPPAPEERLAEALGEASRLRDEFLRAKAETENIRRRAAEDVAKAHRFGIESFATTLLAVRDSLEAALAVESPTVESLREGVQITARQLTAAFEKAAIVEMAPLAQKFDPHRHEALSQVESDQPAGTVVAVVQKGYLLHERVLRPALVVVAREKTPGA
jgi:molecular chaperone GrpE